MEPIIEVNHVTMRFRMANDRINSIKEYKKFQDENGGTYWQKF